MLDRITEESGIPGLFEYLEEKIAQTDLQSLLMAVYRRRASQQSPARVLEQYGSNRFVTPAKVGLRERAAIDRLAFDSAPEFHAVDLSPVAPLGVVSALGPVGQNSVVSTVRNTEVMSDCTNVMALECAVRRRGSGKSPATMRDTVRLCTSQRLVRAQQFTGPGMSAHFTVFALCTSGRSGPNYSFELDALADQLAVYFLLLAALPEIGLQASDVRVEFTDITNEIFADRLQASMMPSLLARFPGVKVECHAEKRTVRDYYQTVRFHLFATTPTGEEIGVADGGFTDWTQKLLANKKERLLISGIGTERLCMLFRK